MQRGVIASGLVAVLCPVTFGQSVSGGTFVTARCGPTFSPAPFFGCDLLTSSHGECPSPREGGLASINDADQRVRIGRGALLADAHARSDFFGTHDNAGTAASQFNAQFQASDILFTDINNPNNHATIDITMNLVLAAQVTSQGHSNCDAAQPGAQLNFGVNAPGGNASGAINISGGGGASADGAFTGYPNDGSLLLITTNGGGVPLGTPVSFWTGMSTNATVLYCDSPPAELGDATASLLLRMPCGTPVFNLPPGITVNSLEMGIVDNTWGGLAITQQPLDSGACPANKASFTVQIAGSGNIGYQWQIEAAPNVWAALADDPVPLDCGSAVAVGANTSNLQVGITGCSNTGAWNHRVRCVIANDCNTLTSDPAMLTICPADFDCTGFVDLDDFAAYAQAFEAGTDNADFDGTGFVDLDDFIAFVLAFETGC